MGIAWYSENVEKIYFPMTVNILTKGHIRALEILSNKGSVVVGLLTSSALKNYKEERMPYEDRLYILNVIASVTGAQVVPQESIDPTENIRKYNCTAIASGDGWEGKELEAINKLGVTRIDINSGCELHSSDLYENK